MTPTAMRPFCACLALLILGGIAAGRAPELETVAPRGAQRGVEFTVAIKGERLDRVQSVLFSRDGLQLKAFEASSQRRATATFGSLPDCPTGEHPFWLVSPTGISEPATLRIGPFPVTEEQEPNDAVQQSQSIRLPSGEGLTVRGVIESADVDSYRLRLAAGERLSAEVEAMRLGGALVDALIEVVGPSGEVVARSDDTPLTRQDPMVSFLAETDGDYVVSVREAAYGGDDESFYQLHLGGFCRPISAYPAGGRPGEKIEMLLLGDARSDATASPTLPQGPPGEYAISIDDGSGGAAPTPLKLRVADLENVLESESEELTDAGRPPFALNGVLSEPGERDAFVFEAVAGEAFDVEVYGARVGSPIDSTLVIEGPDGRSLVENDDGIVHDSSLRFRAVESGRHVARIRDHLDRGGSEYVYRVEFQQIEPKLELTLPTLDRLRPHASKKIAVPRGGRAAVRIALGRSGFSGECRLEVDSLPAGVVADAEIVPVGQHLGLLLLSAERSAPLGAELLGLRAFGESGGGTVIGRLEQEIGLVFGQPRRTPYYSTRVSGAPLVVTEPAPFDLIVEPPAAPLSQDGIKELRVLVQRREGFNGPITLGAPTLPKWVERSEDRVVIPANQSEGVFPLIAGDRAEPGEYAMVLVGTARVDGASVSNASPRFDVRVDKPYASITIEDGATEQGRPASIRCRIEWDRAPSAASKAVLRGLPKHASASEALVNGSSREFVFRVDVGAETPASIHNTLFVELVTPEQGEEVRQYLGRTGTLEVFERGGSAREKRSRLSVLRGSVEEFRLSSTDED